MVEDVASSESEPVFAPVSHTHKFFEEKYIDTLR